VANKGNNIKPKNELDEKKLSIYVNCPCTTQRCPNKIFKTFRIKDFFHFPPGLREFSKKIETGPIGIFRARGLVETNSFKKT
jgi:hypothetical protein